MGLDWKDCELRERMAVDLLGNDALQFEGNIKVC